MDRPRRRLKIDLDELALAFEQNFPETEHYLDLGTGAVVMVTAEDHAELEQLYEEILDEHGEERLPLEEALSTSDLPEAVILALLAAHESKSGLGTRFVRVPHVESYEAYADMEAFIDTVSDRRLRERLWRAIEGRGAFRRFKDVLAGDFRERKRWFAFRDERVDRRVREWLESEGIEPMRECQ